MVFKSTITFDSDIAQLIKKPSDGYANVKTDIKKVVLGVDSLIKAGDILRKIGNSTLLKIRIPNSASKEGRSGGFRLICLVSEQSKTSIFCCLYPKKGKYAKSDLTEGGITLLLNEVATQTENGTLKNVDFLQNESIEITEDKIA